ncbi:acetyl-CoA carboxylase biotin carboxylase subunit [Parvularcula dongshanensis]|uniref:3-methylcrotonyl-CoA carboxylase alpha subunit n=1 Tax=Parvularcula dongshanensis TaxID=1173995 RepID=A0A840I229_9PROT|nr:acetyl-CoA carboxylase biotin carboxylase subunit [Parvularcula dongshanensis]MBB4658248.1 3-methylcrotonyl-CoA carboxylase alpha subunit [Parvularcula dongshanensis]
MIGKLLIANRGEIAVRVCRTARRLGIKTVAVFSEADRDAPHARAADEAYLIGPAPASESYLRKDAILEAAKRAGADAVHPGYGFLSENEGFARACEAAGLAFVGPSPETIALMGSKAAAKDAMQKAGVPLLPGYQGEDQSPATFAREAERIGYPVLLKAVSGGGGKGMRIVQGPGEIEEALAGARREAASAFGDDRVLVEKFLGAPRHVEVQVFGDGRGEVLHLFERDCSVQRRYQKVVEEAPAPKLPGAVRTRLLEAGVRAAEAVSYRGAGTVEFLYDGVDGVYFMEMNTRLQVEHPVTEMITGLDLVEWQLRVASGEGLPLRQDEVRCDGHAIEVRLYAEDPARGDMPSTGRITDLSLPRGRGVRVDQGIGPNSTVTPYYDPMLAKIVAHGPDRMAALRRLRDALAGARVEGVSTNLRFLRRILAAPAFEDGGVTTGFLEGEGAGLREDPAPGARVLAAAALWRGLRAGSPFRLNLPRTVSAAFLGTDGPVPVSLSERGEDWSGTVGDETVRLEGAEVTKKAVLLSEGGARHAYAVRATGTGLLVTGPDGETYPLTLHDPLAEAAAGGADAASLLAPMPATVTAVLVEVGQQVEAGTPLLTIEAMKMEHVVKAPADGRIVETPYLPGDTVAEGAKLLGFEAD